MQPKISVLMSVYNGYPYLGEAIESILNQTFTNFEFIIIDDCSTDGSRELIASYAKKDPRIRLIENGANMGLGKNLVTGVGLAKAELIARMDADDISLPRRLEKQFWYMNANNDYDIVGSWALDIDEEGNVLGTRQCPTEHDKIVKYIWTCPIIHPSVMFKKESITKVGSYGDEPRRQDYALWFRCAKAGLRFSNIPEALIEYRFSDDYFRKNNIAALLTQASIGLKGCRLVGASPVAYIGVLVPLVKGIMPKFLKRPMAKFLKRFDPRNA